MKTINHQKLIAAIENQNPIAIALIDRLAASLDSLIDDIHEDDLDISETDANDYFNSLFTEAKPSNELGHITVIPKVWFTDSPYYKSLMDGTHGSFAQSLCKAWYNADRVNRKRLSEAFPDYFFANDYILF